MSEIADAVGQWIINNVGWSIVIFLFFLSGLFKITKREIDPLGWIIGWFGKALTKDVRKNIQELQIETRTKFSEIKHDRNAKVDELKGDYNEQISALKSDLDSFEKSTNQNISEMKKGTENNCQTLKKRIDEMEAATQKSNDMQTIRQIKAHVLDFANSCMNKRKHTKKEFENIIDENTQYEQLVKKYKLVNDVYKEDFAYVMRIYHKCRDEGSFLKESDA